LTPSVLVLGPIVAPVPGPASSRVFPWCCCPGLSRPLPEDGPAAPDARPTWRGRRGCSIRRLVRGEPGAPSRFLRAWGGARPAAKTRRRLPGRWPPFLLEHHVLARSGHRAVGLERRRSVRYTPTSTALSPCRTCRCVHCTSLVSTRQAGRGLPCPRRSREPGAGFCCPNTGWWPDCVPPTWVRLTGPRPNPGGPARCRPAHRFVTGWPPGLRGRVTGRAWLAADRARQPRRPPASTSVADFLAWAWRTG